MIPEHQPVVRCSGLTIGYQGIKAIEDVDFELNAGEILGLVGESGCGKSTLATAVLGYIRGAGRKEAGMMEVLGKDVFRLSAPELQAMRGRRMALVPQNPGQALSYHKTIGAQLIDTLRAHDQSLSRDAAGERARSLFRSVELPEPETIGHRFPHQLSGGQQQRACIAIALSCAASVLVLDEPTTSLDATTQSQVVALLRRLREKTGVAMLYVTHDLALLSTLADRIAVMYAGKLIETGPAHVVLNSPAHPYTRGLIASAPRLDGTVPVEAALAGSLVRASLPAGCPFTPRCPHQETACATGRQSLAIIAPGHGVACRRAPLTPALRVPPGERGRVRRADAELLAVQDVSIHYGQGRLGGRSTASPAVSGLSFAVRHGEVLALVGESGSGKSSIARAIIGAVAPTSGHILLDGSPLAPNLARRPHEVLRRIGFIFQNPDTSLNPRRRLADTLLRPARRLAGLDRAAAQRRAEASLASVGLDASYLARYPDELSGGERQRVAIARALVPSPHLLICDEILSALDASVQSQVLSLLESLREQMGVAMLFISHDLAVVRRIADRVAVLREGRLVELASVGTLFNEPAHDYTRALLAAAPQLVAGNDRGAIQ